MAGDLLSVEEARLRILEAMPTLPAEIVALSQARGRVLAEDLRARRTQPPVAVSAMDGYAVRAEDLASLPITLSLIGEAPAGGAHESRLAPGEAVRIFTGGPVPDGADTVVIQEDTDQGMPKVLIREWSGKGANIRVAGTDFFEGDILLKSPKRLSARDIGLAAAMNHPWIPVTRRPRVALLATGNEIIRPGEPLGPFQIVSSNGPALAAAVESRGGLALDLGIARDDEHAIRSLAEGARGADLLLTMGGVSVGDHDLVRRVLGEAGLDIDFWKIAMKPGKPLMFGRMGSTPVIGLPGNPVSSLVCALLFVLPALERLQGLPGKGPEQTRALLGAPLAANTFREDYLRARIELDSGPLPIVHPMPMQDSSQMHRFAEADALILRPPNAPRAEAGEEVRIIPLAPLL